MKCLLVLGGEIRDDQAFLQACLEADHILAADGGVIHLQRVGQRPEVLMGDMDSIPEALLREMDPDHCEILRFPSEKDETDGALVLKEALRRNYENIEIWGALGGRMDHSWVNVMLLKKARAWTHNQKTPPRIRLRDKGLSVFLPVSGERLQGHKGDLLSLFALSEIVEGFYGEGLKYQPPEGRFRMEEPNGISNVWTSDQVILKWESGCLLCFHWSGEEGTDIISMEGKNDSKGA